MNKPNILDPDVAQRLCDGATLVTATKRLAREIRQQFNQHQHAQGEQVWDTADILPFEAWTFRLWRFMCDQSATTQNDRMVLNTLQSKAVWTYIISTDINKNHHYSQPLWNIAATVGTAMEAWRISCQWHIPIDECAKSFHEDHRSFARWADLFIRQCQNNHWIDGQQLIDVVMATWAETSALLANVLTDTKLMWMGFDGFNVQQQRLIDLLGQHDVQVDIPLLANKHLANCRFQQYHSETEQWLATAHWIKGKLERAPEQRLAVVVPNLHQSRDAIDYALSQVLSPHHLLNSGSDRAKPFHISLGIKLHDAPAVKAALLLLSLATTARISTSTISKVILNPFIGGADSECYARSELEFWCRQYLPHELSFASFLGWLKQKHKEGQAAPPLFLEKINANDGFMTSIKEKHSFSYWSEFFLHWLENLGWPGERTLNSEQYQTVEAFKREVCVLRSLARVGKAVVSESVSVATALTILKQRLNEQPFEPESPRVNVDVLGVMETSGIQFDAIWFGSLTERGWPPTLQTNPFIPHKLQQQSGYHRASIELNAEYSKQQQNRLRHQCKEMVLSYYAFERDVELRPSAFFKQIDPTAEQSPPSLIKKLQATKPDCESFTDTQGLSKSASNARGGSSVIRDQAACPFRAYAKHRLGARDAEHRQPGLDAADRGQLIHGVLEGVWRTLQSSQKLATLSDHAIKKIVDDNIATCSKPFFHKSGMGRGFFKTQSQWLGQLLLEWLAVEKSSASTFRIVELEKPQQLALGKLTLNFKIDRIDELADKTLRLIDYKTGLVGSITSWFGERPQEPQLPLYVLAQYANANEHKNNSQATLSALLFGQVRAGDSKYVGIDENNLLKTTEYIANQLSASENTELDDELNNWQALIAYWNAQLTKLADQYYAGHAQVNPLDKSTCRYCDLPSLCRIGNRMPNAQDRVD